MDAVAGLYIFGSTARGDSDLSSDLDVLVIYSSHPRRQLRLDVKQILFDEFGQKLTLAEYSRRRIDEMFAEGHLFAWHLYQEAQPIIINGLYGKTHFDLIRPSPYVSGIEDAQRFMVLLESIDLEVEVGGGSIVHEAGLAYLCLRNIAMSLSCVGAGSLDFTRYSPINLSCALDIPPPCSSEVYNKLIQARHASQRGLPAPEMDIVEFRDAIKSSIEWSKFVKGRVEDEQISF